MNGTTAYALSKQYVSDTADSLGSLKGAPCTIKNITEVDGGQKVTFEWTGTSGTKQTSEMTVKNGVSVTGINDKGNGVFTLLLSDGSESDPIQTIKGQDGFTTTITENADNTDKIYKLDVTTADGTFTTPNLKGADGTGGTGVSTWSEISDKPFESLSTDFSVENGELKVIGGTGSGEENNINSISVNGTPILPDENKNVDITVPTISNDYTDADKELVATISYKVNKTDIVDDLLSTDLDKPLSANQGNILDGKISEKSTFVTLTKTEYKALEESGEVNPDIYYAISDDSDIVSIVNVINENSKENEIPTAKAVYNKINGEIETVSNDINKLNCDMYGVSLSYLFTNWESGGYDSSGNNVSASSWYRSETHNMETGNSYTFNFSSDYRIMVVKTSGGVTSRNIITSPFTLDYTDEVIKIACGKIDNSAVNENVLSNFTVVVNGNKSFVDRIVDIETRATKHETDITTNITNISIINNELHGERTFVTDIFSSFEQGGYSTDGTKGDYTQWIRGTENNMVVNTNYRINIPDGYRVMLVELNKDTGAKVTRTIYNETFTYLYTGEYNIGFAIGYANNSNITPDRANVIWIGDGDGESYDNKISRAKSNLYNKKWVIKGDSITDEQYMTNIKKYYTYIEEETSIIPDAYGAGGSSYAREKTNTSCTKVEHGIYYQGIPDLPKDNIDILTVFGGTNDWGCMSYSLGEINDVNIDSTATDENGNTIPVTINAYIRKCFDALVERYSDTNTIIDIWTPLPRQECNPMNENVKLSDYTLGQLSDRIIALAKLYGFRYLDLYHESSLYPYNDTAFANQFTDTVHINTNSHKRISGVIIKHLESLV